MDQSELNRLAELRQAIRRADDEILRWVAQRETFVHEVGSLKRRMGLPLRDMDLESEIIATSQERAKSLGIDPIFAATLASLLIERAVSLQEKTSLSPGNSAASSKPKRR